MRISHYLILAACLLFSAQAIALGLDAAKQQGLVGEQPNGYLGVIEATPGAVKLVSTVNDKRRQAYQRIARKNGITLDQVARIAGQKAIEKTAPGNFVKTPSGQWVKK